jgi:signal transduction histidine kinase
MNKSARERLVLAREEERRRIRNDLHDGLAPTLSSLQLQLGAVRNLIRQDPACLTAESEALHRHC